MSTGELKTGSGGAGWSFFRHNLTKEREEDLPPGKGAATAMMLAPNGTRTATAAWAARVLPPSSGLCSAPLPMPHSARSCLHMQLTY